MSGYPFKSADGDQITIGAKADAAVTNPASSASLVALNKGQLTALGTTADTAWTTGAGSIVAVLKGLYTAIGTATGVTGAGTAAAATRTVEALASTGAITSVTSVATDATILAANASRQGFVVYNDSTSVLYLALASVTSSSTVYSVQVGPGATYENYEYAGILKGIWSAVNGAARVTEIS